jgi:hypothetical protein
MRARPATGSVSSSRDPQPRTSAVEPAASPAGIGGGGGLNPVRWAALADRVCGTLASAGSSEPVNRAAPRLNAEDNGLCVASRDTSRRATSDKRICTRCDGTSPTSAVCNKKCRPRAMSISRVAGRSGAHSAPSVTVRLSRRLGRTREKRAPETAEDIGEGTEATRRLQPRVGDALDRVRGGNRQRG